MTGPVQSTSERIPDPEALTCSSPREEVAAIGGLLLVLAARSIDPPERTEAGYRLRLPDTADVAATLEEFARRDKACCPFLEFQIERERDELRLEVSGPEAASRLLDLTIEFARLGAGNTG